MRAQARREAELILGEAHSEAREVQRKALAENERLRRESRRIRFQLEEAFAALGGPEQTGEGEREPAEEDTSSDEERSWYGLPDANAA